MQADYIDSQIQQADLHEGGREQAPNLVIIKYLLLICDQLLGGEAGHQIDDPQNDEGEIDDAAAEGNLFEVIFDVWQRLLFLFLILGQHYIINTTMYKIAFQNDSHHGVQAKLLQSNSAVIVRASHLSPSSMPEAQSSLLLDFSIRDVTRNQKKWNGFQHTLQQIFSNIIQVAMMPGCQCKINIFILMEGESAESAIINCCWATFVKLGLPMSRSVWSLSEKGNIIVASLFGEHEIVFGKYRDNLSEQNIAQMKQFQRVVRQALEAQ